MDTKKNQEFSEVPFQCFFNEFGFLLDSSSKINLHVWFYFIVFLTILYITLETGHMESSVLLSLSASCLFMKLLSMHIYLKSKCRFNLPNDDTVTVNIAHDFVYSIET